MPFKSKAQARFMFATKPKMAKEWASVTPSIKSLPQHSKDSTHQGAARRLRRQAMKRGNAQRAHVESKHPFRAEPKQGGVKAQKGSY